MARQPTKSPSHKERLQSLYGGMVASQDALRRATASRQKAFETQFKRQAALRAKYAALMQKVHAPLLDAYRKDTRVLGGIRELSKLSAATQKRSLSPPRIALHKPRIVADLGATVVAPYDFEEMLFSSTGNPPNASSATKASGTITSSIGWNYNSPSSASDTVGVGIFFHPPTDCPGTLKIATSVAFTYDWTTSCAFSGAHSDGWIGLAVERFTSNGFPAGMLVDQRLFLWNVNSGWADSHFEDGSNTGFPLFAQCTVDGQHSYHIWVRCGGSVSSAGFGGWFGSIAGSRIFGRVPSIAWELI